MTRMAFDSQNCRGATSGATGRHYEADRGGIIHVEDSRDVKCLSAGGYTIVGSVARASKYWVCDNCSRDCNLNHCSKCDSSDLRKVEK